MATNHTEHCLLSQWEPDDQVLRTDFNADHAKLDAALGALTAGQLQMSTGKYQGDGTYQFSVTFPFQPKFLYIQKMHTYDERFIWADGESVISLWADDCAYCKMTGDGHVVTFVENTMTVETHVLVYGDRRARLNQLGLWYFYLILG